MATPLLSNEPGAQWSYRIGSVPYLNAVPLTHGLECPVIFEPPSKLATLLEQRQLDAGLVSVTAALFSEQYHIVDGVSIASLGEVKSVLLGHRLPISQIKEVYCDTASLTSVQLLRVLLAEKGLYPEFKPLPSYSGPGDLPDFFLLIGDPALDFVLAPLGCQVWDLGSAWLELTGLPFVYAVWAVQGNANNRELCRILREAKAFGLETLEDIIRNRTEYNYQFRKDYLSWHIHYHLGEDEKRGLAAFVHLLRKHVSRPVFTPTFVS